jgi:hypothetical protein
MPALSGQAQELARKEAQRLDPNSPVSRAEQEKQRQTWREEWLRRRRRQLAEEIRAQEPEKLQNLVRQLDAHLAARNAHPSIRKRLAANGWQHPLVEYEMIKFYADLARGGVGEPTAEDLLQIAAESSIDL